MNKTALLSAFAAAALLAGCRTTQTNHVRRGAFGGGESVASRQPARVRSAAPAARVAPAPAAVTETPLAPAPAVQPRPAAVQSGPVVARPALPPDVQPAGAVDPAWPVPMWNTPPASAVPARPPQAKPVPAAPAVAAPAAPVAAPAPAPAPAPTAAPAAPAFETYKVKSGDVAGRIANSHGMTLKEFLEANDMTLEQANKLREGAKVKVWAGQEALKPGPAVRPAKPAAADDPNVYVVQPGDTLLGIAAKTGVPVATLMKNNGIDNPNAIRAGRALVLKKEAAPVAQPVAQPGARPTAVPAGTAAEPPARPRKPQKPPKQPEPPKRPEAAPVAAPPPPAPPPAPAPAEPPKQLDASVPLDQVPVAGTDKSLEDLLDGLSISDARSQAEEKKEEAAKQVENAVQTAKNAAETAAKAAPAGFKYYTVKEGENLYHLTARFKVPLAKLRELNDLPKTATKLDPGTVLLIPDVSAVAP